MKKIYTDNLAVFNVIGNLLNDPSLTERYDMEPEDFGDIFYQIIFKASTNLYSKGFEEITVLDLDGYLREHPKSYQTFNENGGVAIATNAKTKTSLSSFEYYYDIMRKMSLLTSLASLVDLDFMFDPDHPDANVREKQRAQLLEWSISDIMSEVDTRISRIRDHHMRDTASTTGNVGEGLDSLVDSLMENPDLGVPLYGKYINTITRGCRTKKFYLRSAPTGAGKAIPDYTVIPTPNGFKSVGEVEVGDNLFGRNGKPTKVLAVYPQEEEKEVCKITFKDGRIAESCEEHLWTCLTEGVEQTLSLKDILAQVEEHGYLTDAQEYRFSTPISSAVHYPAAALTVDPYELGVALRGDKGFIPEPYLTASASQREALLKGLLRTRDLPKPSEKVYFKTASKRISEDVSSLVRSLGGTSSIAKDCRYYRVSITLRCESKKYNPIISIEKTGRKTSMTCFTVDAEDSLFLMNDYITTHNTRTMIADATSIATSEIYNLSTKKWDSSGDALPVSFIVTELDKEEVQTMCLAFLSGVNENHILRGAYLPGELDRVRKAAKILGAGKLYITELPDFNMDDIEMTIRRNIREYGTRQIFFDYIHSSLKIFEEISRKTKGMSLREDQVLFMMSIRLKDIANELDVFILSATQVNASYTDETTMPDQNMLRGSKAIADKIDVGMMLLPIRETEREALASVIMTGKGEPTHSLSIYKNRRGELKSARIWLKADLSICRMDALFITDQNMVLLNNVPDTVINIQNTQKTNESKEMLF